MENLAIVELVAHPDSDHLDRTDRSILGVGGKLFNFFDDFHTRGDSPKNWVLRGARRKPVQIVVVHGIYKKLTTAAVRSSSVGHGERARLIGELGVLRVLVGNRSVWTVSSTRLGAFGVPTVGTTELEHEPIDDPMKMQAVVEPALRQREKVSRRDGHLVPIEFDDDFAFGCLEYCCRIRHPIWITGLAPRIILRERESEREHSASRFPSASRLPKFRRSSELHPTAKHLRSRRTRVHP